MAAYFTATRRNVARRTIRARVPVPRNPYPQVTRRRQLRPSSRGVVQGALLAPSRAASVGTSQGATTATAGSGVVFPTTDGAGTNWWIDVTVTDQDPAVVAATPLQDAAEDADQTVVWSLLGDWDRTNFSHALADLTGAVASISIERASTGDLPVEAGLVEGFASARLTAVVDGELADGVTLAADAFAPYRTDSPLYLKPLEAAPVTCDIGLVTDQGPQLVRQFTGQVQSIRVDSSDRTVQITALDPADVLRASITFPAYAMDISRVLNLEHKFYARSQALIDFVLRRNGIYASPPARSDAQISCTAHGWLAAEAGRSATPAGTPPHVTDETWWVDGPFDMLAARGTWSPTTDSWQDFFTREAYSPTPGNGMGIAAWLRVGNDMGVTPSSDYHIIFRAVPCIIEDTTTTRMELGILGTGSVGGTIWGGSTPNTNGFIEPITSTTHWQYCAIHWAHMANGNTRITFRVNGKTTFGDAPTPALTSTVAPYMHVTAFLSGVDWSNFQLWYSPTAPAATEWPGEFHTPQASIDVGLNKLTHLPDVVGADSWTTIKDIAGAEYGLVGFDEAGEFFFRSREASTDPSVIAKTITADGSLRGLAIERSTDSIRNVVTTETVAGYLNFNSKIVESRDVQEFQSPVGISTYLVPLEYGAIGTPFSQALPQITSAAWNDDVLWGFVPVDAGNPTNEIASGVNVLFTTVADRLGMFTVYNFSTAPVRFATTSGSPAIRMQGWSLVLQPAVLAEVRSNGSVATYGERSLEVTASPYRQLKDPLDTVAGGLLTQLSNPLPVIDQIPINGDPSLRLGNTVRLIDPRTNGSMRANIVKITRDVSDGELRDSLSVRPVASPGLGILNDPELGILNDTLILAP